jgi:hypothetical protein
MTMILPQTDIEREYWKCSVDPCYFIDTYVMIQHPERGTISFKLWDWQMALLDRFQDQKRIIILKARQIGASELAASYALWMTRFHPSKKALIISKNEDAATELMTRATFAHDHLPPWLQAGRESFDGCTINKSNMSYLEFALYDEKQQPHPSSIQSLPATKSAGRSKSASLVILDEWAFQQFDKEIWTGIKPTVEHGSLIGISTANGLGNMFHKTWANAVAGKNEFTPIFLSWRRHPERNDEWYSREAKDNEPWQLHQEYPSEPTEAFIQSGRPVFDSTYLAKHGQRVASQDLPLEQADGLTIWERPQEGHTYVIGADVAEGTVTGDYDAACVIDRETWHQVAELHGHWPFDIYAQKLDRIGRYYNNALLAIERNNHGHAVLLALTSGIAHVEDDKKPNIYQNLYHTSDPLHLGQVPQVKPGWETTSRSKPLAIDSLAKALREETYQVRSQSMLDEALIYSYQDNGSMSAPSGMNDDLVISHAIAIHLATQPDAASRMMGWIDAMGDTLSQRIAAQEHQRKPY